MIDGAAWSSALFGDMSGKGFGGSRLMDFTDAVGPGSQTHVVGKPFTTTDAGLIPGAGPSPGTGTGITALVGATISTLVFGLAVGLFGQAGAWLMDLTDSIGDTCEAQMLTALLTSTHSPVFSGAGVVDVGSVGVIPAGWGSDIDAAGSGLGFVGVHWPDLANAIGMGCGQHVIAAGTGNVTISGSFGGSTPPGPVPGAGVGAGVIS